MRQFAVYSPTLGLREDYPGIFLNKALLPDANYVQIRWGEIWKAKMRSPELLRTTYAVSSIDVATQTVRISGNHITEFPNGASIVLYDTEDSYAAFTLSTTATYSTTSTVLTVTTGLSASTPQDFVFNSENVGSIDPANNDFLKVHFPDSNPALRYETLTLSDGTERLVGFTKAHIYYWDTTSTNWTALFTSSSECTYWDCCQYGDNLCATNNVDRPVYWDGNTANVFENIDTQYSSSSSEYVAKAKFIAAYHSYLFLGNVQLANGTRYQNYVYWSTIGEGVLTGGWIQSATSDAGADYVAGDGEITGGFGLWNGYLVIFKRKSIRKYWYVGLSIPFEESELSPKIGCLAPGSVGNDWSGDLYFYGTDQAFHGVTAGIISQAIDPTARDITPSLVESIRFLAVDEYKELRWAIPYGNSATANNKVLVYVPAEQRWDCDMDIAVTAFGAYTRQTNWTWDTLPFDSWDEWGWDSWDAIEAGSDVIIDLCGDASGYTYDLHGGYLDDGSEYDSYFVITTDLADKKALPVKKRIHQIYVYYRAESTGSLDLYVKRDNETNFQSKGSITLTGSNDILRGRLAVDCAAYRFEVKGKGTDAFRVLGLEFEFDVEGLR